jgi:hypothetical protein
LTTALPLTWNFEMSLHINRFVDNIKAHEARGQRDFSMTLRDAKDLHSDITKLLLKINELQDQLLEAHSAVVEVNLDGGAFKSPS